MAREGEQDAMRALAARRITTELVVMEDKEESGLPRQLRFPCRPIFRGFQRTGNIRTPCHPTTSVPIILR